MDPIIYSMETADHPIVQRATVLTNKGQAMVHLIRLRHAITDLDQEDRADVVDHIRELLTDLDQAA